MGNLRRYLDLDLDEEWVIAHVADPLKVDDVTRASTQYIYLC
jgi:hypothetical protein